MSDFVRVAKVSDVPDPGKMTVEVDDEIVVMVRVGGKLSCIDDVCTHDGGPPGATAGLPSSADVPPGATAGLPSSADDATRPPNAAPDPAAPRTDVFIEMTMTSPACPAGPQLIGGAKREVASIDGVGQVEVK